MKATRARWSAVKASFCIGVGLLALAGCGGGGGSTGAQSGGQSVDPPPTGSQGMKVSPTVIAPGGSATLQWSGYGPNCKASGSWDGEQPADGSKKVAPSHSGVYTYALSCPDPVSGRDAEFSATLDVTPSVGKIKHVVIVIQENRTPDNLFHGLPGADIANSGVDSKGNKILLTPVPLDVPYDVNHSHTSFSKMYDGGKMDGADLIDVKCVNAPANCAPSEPEFQYVDPSEVGPYFQLAEQYSFADRMFQTNQGPSYPAHQFLLAGTSAPTADSPDFVSENNAPGNEPAGCTAPPDVTVQLIDPMGNEDQSIYPCFEHETLPDLLDDANIDWRYYSPSDITIWTAPNSIRHLRMGANWDKVIMPETNVLNDIAGGKLAPVTWVTPDGKFSDHAGANDGSGPSWVASIVNAIGSSPYWNDTAIFILWDDWGGWYDHVAPPVLNSYEFGFRVPLIVVSPYARNGYVSHTEHNFGSILKFIEENYGLRSLGYADAMSDDLQDCFDFSRAPTPFRTVAAKYDAQYFIAHSFTAAPTDPDDD